jgi:hypothetical protein
VSDVAFDDPIKVREMRFVDAPGEVWYGASWRGRDMNAGWADPDVAHRHVVDEYAHPEAIDMDRAITAGQVAAP